MKLVIQTPEPYFRQRGDLLDIAAYGDSGLRFHLVVSRHWGGLGWHWWPPYPDRIRHIAELGFVRYTVYSR